MEDNKFTFIEIVIFLAMLFAIIFGLIKAANIYKLAEKELTKEYTIKNIISEYEKYNDLIVDQNTQISNITDIEKLILEAAKKKDKVIIKDNGSKIYEVEYLTKIETSKVYSKLQELLKKSKTIKVELIVEDNIIKGVVFNGNT